MKKITIYTDGSSLGNPGAGGWGALLIYQDKQKEISGNIASATNNQMEMTAAIEALKALKTPCNVVLYTDSQYLKRGMSEWLDKWLRNNWQSSNKKPVKNIELWQELYNLSKIHNITWRWVKAHNNDPYNEKVDRLAYNAAQKIKN